MTMQRRTLLKSGGSIVLSLGLAELAHGATIITVRVWPAPEYSRVTIESDSALSTKQTFVPSPPRLAVDIEGITLNPALKELVAKVRADDPNIAGIRVGQFSPNVVRLVVDLNREPDAIGTIPPSSDGIDIPGNHISAAARAARIADYHIPYHDEIAMLCAHARPAMILSLHSFTPVLATACTPRPWHIGVLYNEDDRLARIAIPALATAGLHVGDQLPYSGKALNYTMNRHAEGNGIPYLGLEMRQDMVTDAAGQSRFAEIIHQILEKCRNHLA